MSLSKPPAFPLSHSSCHHPSVSSSTGRRAGRASPGVCCRVHTLTCTDSPLCVHAASLHARLGGSDTNEAPLGDSQSPIDCERLHVCSRSPLPSTSISAALLLSLSDCKQAGGVPHMSRNNKKGDLRAFAAGVRVCVCLLGRMDL